MTASHMTEGFHKREEGGTLHACGLNDVVAVTQVHLCGSFTRWVETVPMAPVDGSPGVFSVVVHLPPG